MKLSDVKNILEAEVITGEDLLDTTVTSGFGCDLIILSAHLGLNCPVIV